MKLINYNYGYMEPFNCSIHGKIVMTRKEWEEALLFLFRGAKRWLPSYPWVVSRLREDIKRGIKLKNSTLYSIRVPATATIAKKYGLERYKQANYMIEVIDHELKIKSLWDAMAECVCGWHYRFTGEMTKGEIRKEWKKHI